MNSDLFDTIYTFIYGLFNSSNINGYSQSIMGVSTTLPSWIAITVTVIILMLLFAFLVKVVIWCFKLVSNLFRRF